MIVFYKNKLRTFSIYLERKTRWENQVKMSTGLKMEGMVQGFQRSVNIGEFKTPTQVPFQIHMSIRSSAVFIGVGKGWGRGGAALGIFLSYNS